MGQGRSSPPRDLTEAIGDLAMARSGAHVAYRANLGPDGAQLPLAFVDVVRAVVDFADENLG